jgi:transcriptional regulator with XRE-family HTH domain
VAQCHRVVKYPTGWSIHRAGAGSFWHMSGVARSLVVRVGRRIGELRRQRGLTQAELGERLGIAQKNVHRLESGTQNLTLRTLERVAAALELPVDALWGDDAGHDTDADRHWAPLWSETHASPRPVPILSLAAAAGFARDGQLPAVRGWALVDRPADERYFIVRTEGDSMAPTIPDGSWCLYRRAVLPPAVGSIVLVELDRVVDGGRYLVKRLRSLGMVDGQRQVVLESINPAYAPLTLSGFSDDDFHLIAEFVDVIDDDNDL